MTLQDAKTGQIWQCPEGEYYSVVDVMDFTSTKLVVFEGFGEPGEEALAFDFVQGWIQIRDFAQPAGWDPELRPH